MHAVPVQARRGHQISETGVTDGCYALGSPKRKVTDPSSQDSEGSAVVCICAVTCRLFAPLKSQSWKLPSTETSNPASRKFSLVTLLASLTEKVSLPAAIMSPCPLDKKHQKLPVPGGKDFT
ncbi:hypothetical protein STEG23_001827 [Scotinomys teguina]